MKKLLYFYMLLMISNIQAMEEDENGRRVVKEASEEKRGNLLIKARREDWESLENELDFANIRKPIFLFMDEISIQSGQKNNFKNRLFSSNFQSEDDEISEGLGVSEEKSPEILKNICINFISKNKKLFSKEKLLALPIDIQMLLGVEQDCAICLTELNGDRKELSCGHDQFHLACIEQWREMRNPAVCPICREKIS